MDTTDYINHHDMISIIVPVYNPGSFLRPCLESIRSQTYHNFECILIDDGSTDGSGKICDEYEQKDLRFKAFHQLNAGISLARNKGLDSSKGSFITFVDSDDIILDNMYLETLYENIEDCDCCFSGYIDVFEDNMVQHIPNNTYVRGHERIIDDYLNNGLKKWTYAPWGKLFRAKMVYGLRFKPDLVVGEDIVYNLYALASSQSIRTIQYAGYGFRKNPNSITHQIAYVYTPLYEHSYSFIQNEIANAKRQLGIDEKSLNEEKINSAPERLFNEMTNLFKPGSPYEKKDITKKIIEIMQDSEFVSLVRLKDRKHCGRSEKIAILSTYIKNPRLVELLYKIIVSRSRRKIIINMSNKR